MKSQKQMLLFYQQLLAEAGGWVGVSTQADFKTVCQRVEDEGWSFLTITLPKFGKDLEQALEEGGIQANHFEGYKRKRTADGGLSPIPVFLGGFLENIFDIVSGELRSHSFLVDSVRIVRQVTLMFGKMELDCTPKRVQQAFDKYVECERELRDIENVLFMHPRNRANYPGPPPQHVQDKLASFAKASNVLLGNLFTAVDKKVYDGLIVPKHGPGATADKLKGNRKYDQKQWTERLEVYFSWTEFLYPSYTLALCDEDRVTHVDPGSEVPVTVTAVPKTLKTPRIIAIEPTAMQYVQQGLLEVFEQEVEKDYNLNHFLNWSSQKPNRDLAKQASMAPFTGSESLATLDLSEASDRVSNQLVMSMLQNHPHLKGAVDACRSRTADVNGELYELVKFASMGSALCFPFESFVFMTIILSAIADSIGTPASPALLKTLRGRVRVYGDDIIVPVRFAKLVIERLEFFGLKVNRSKSFMNGMFRESCGGEYYDGTDVSLTRVKREFPTSRAHVSELVSTVSLRNLLFTAGYRTTVQFLDTIVEGIIPFPIVEPTSPALGRWSDDPPKAERMHPDLQVPLVRAAVVKEKLPRSYLDGSGAIMKFFLRRGESPFNDVKHLERAGRPISSTIKIGWARTF